MTTIVANQRHGALTKTPRGAWRTRVGMRITYPPRCDAAVKSFPVRDALPAAHSTNSVGRGSSNRSPQRSVVSYEYALLHSVSAAQASYRGSGGLNTRVTGIRTVPQLPALRFFVRRGNDCSRMSGRMLARSSGLARWAIRTPAAGSQASADYREHGAELRRMSGVFVTHRTPHGNRHQ